MSRFQRGRSGNPSGRPRGAKTTVKLLASEFISDEDVRQVMATVVAAAKGGDMTAAGMVLDRVLPKLRPSTDGGDDIGLEALVASAVSISVVTGVPAQDPRPAPSPQAPLAALDPPPAIPVTPAPPPPRPPLRLALGERDGQDGRVLTSYEPFDN